MQAQPFGPSVELPMAMGPPNARDVPKWVRWAHASAGICAFGGAPDGATQRVRVVPTRARRAHASAAI
eukprot:9468322-Pyramimonas_sp.AAC.2